MYDQTQTCLNFGKLPQLDLNTKALHVYGIKDNTLIYVKQVSVWEK